MNEYDRGELHLYALNYRTAHEPSEATYAWGQLEKHVRGLMREAYDEGYRDAMRALMPRIEKGAADALTVMARMEEITQMVADVNAVMAASKAQEPADTSLVRYYSSDDRDAP